MGLIFARGLFSRRIPKREKRENFPHAKISTFTVFKCRNKPLSAITYVSYMYMYKLYSELSPDLNAKVRKYCFPFLSDHHTAKVAELLKK